MAESLDEAVKLLILLSHRAAVLDDTRLNGRVDALVNAYLAGVGTNREQLAKAFSEKAPPTTASERRPDRAGRRLVCSAKYDGKRPTKLDVAGASLVLKALPVS
jgi:hypothetical protein